MNWTFMSFEVITILLFLWTLRRELSAHRSAWTLYVAVPYGIVLEFLTIKGFALYSYGTQFALMVAGVPVAIGFMWAVVIYWSMKLAEKLKVSSLATAMIAAYVAIAFDLVLDPVAVRLGYWTWGLALNEQWFGVLVGNYFGWLFVVTYYSAWLLFLPKEYVIAYWHPSRTVLAALASIAMLIPSLYISKSILYPQPPIYAALVLLAVLIVLAIYVGFQRLKQEKSAR